ncbi:MAG: ribonuclease PH [Myxococcota bacterium]|nr:ribonuclease PH [Myxococcota bacterium]
MSVTKRIGGRALDELREISIEVDYTKWAEGSVLCCFGDTKVICTATIEERIPPWLKEKSPVQGWVTAEYSMLPRSTDRRMRREATAGKVGGRTHEISRLIGRAIRAGVDMRKLGPRMVSLDCDVIQADGGTRTASITGAWVATQIALWRLMKQGKIESNPVERQIAAVSLGVIDGEVRLDLNYEEDQRADTDLNLVMTEEGGLVEIQGTAEGEVLRREELDLMLTCGQKGIEQLFIAQQDAVDRANQS